MARASSIIAKTVRPSRSATPLTGMDDDTAFQSLHTLTKDAPVGDLDTALARIAEAERLIALQKERIEHLEGLALTDELTGLVNRRGFLQALQRELAAAQRERTAGGVLVLCDLDGFKQINDTHGHAAGDAYLRDVAEILLAKVRPSDLVARLGGDEFAILLTRINANNGLARATALEEYFNGCATMWNQHKLPLRASFGLALYTGKDRAEDLMTTADFKLYAHKARHGKGRKA